jgi:hypothetical protein
MHPRGLRREELPRAKTGLRWRAGSQPTLKKKTLKFLKPLIRLASMGVRRVLFGGRGRVMVAGGLWGARGDVVG